MTKYITKNLSPIIKVLSLFCILNIFFILQNHIICNANADSIKSDAIQTNIKDGEYLIDVVLEGGSGKASLSSPSKLIVKDSYAYAIIEWSSSNYDYMKLGNKIFKPINTDGNSVFEIPITVFDEPMQIIADTTAMSTPHEISYTLTFQMDSVKKENNSISTMTTTIIIICCFVILSAIIIGTIIHRKNK